MHFLLTLQGATLCVAAFSQKAVDETFQYLTKNFFVGSHSNVLAAEDPLPVRRVPLTAF